MKKYISYPKYIQIVNFLTESFNNTICNLKNRYLLIEFVGIENYNMLPLSKVQS